MNLIEAFKSECKYMRRPTARFVAKQSGGWVLCEHIMNSLDRNHRPMFRGECFYLDRQDVLADDWEVTNEPK